MSFAINGEYIICCTYARNKTISFDKGQIRSSLTNKKLSLNLNSNLQNYALDSVPDDTLIIGTIPFLNYCTII